MTLSSDHVNYLILRYLQEAGHENAAVAFYRDWHRQPEFRDPENYPFAPVVARGELIHVIQDGLHHDELIARVKKNQRKFRFTNAPTRDVGGAASAAKRKGRTLSVMRPPDEFPIPAPKRQRRSEEPVHVNGDAMEVDAASASADAEDDGEPVSPAVASETEVVEIPERYDSMDVAVQTDVKTGPKTSTLYWKVDRANATIYHSVFNPDPDPRNVRTLLTVGEGLCRFYEVPASAEDAPQVMSVDEPSLPPNSVVTASTWHPEGHISVCAIDAVVDLVDDEQVSEQKIICHRRSNNTQSDLILPPLLEPAGIILLTRYSPDSQYLLVIRTNLKRGLALVYDMTDCGSQEPQAWRISEHQILDATWGAGPSFILCGENGLVEAYGIDRAAPPPEPTFSETDIQSVGLTPISMHIHAPKRKWDKVVLDTHHDIFMLVSIQDRQMIVGRRSALDADEASYISLPGTLTALAVRPKSQQSSGQPCIWAASFDDGSCELYTFTDGSARTVVSVGLSNNTPALALAWSPDGRHLAVGGTDLIQIWNLLSLVFLSWGICTANRDVSQEALVTWRPDAAATAPRNGESEHDKPVSEPSVSWSADGKMLAFAVDRQLAVISFRPPLSQQTVIADGHENGPVEINGRVTPP